MSNKYVIISDNCESFSDHNHTVVFSCETEEDAIEAVEMMRGWIGRAALRISQDWKKFVVKPGMDRNDLCLIWQDYCDKVEKIPIVGVGVTDFCFPDYIGMDEKILKQSIGYIEIPTWARSMI